MALEIGRTLRARTAKEWRAWLEKNHDRASEIWLVHYSKASGRRSVSYSESVEEALCFGWIDSIVKKLDADSRAQRFTPRRPGSPMSELNKERVRRLIEEGKMTPVGLAAAGDLSSTPTMPRDIIDALKRDRETWANFQQFPESYKLIRIAWIEGARKRPEVFEQRLRYFLRMTKQNKRFGEERG